MISNIFNKYNKQKLLNVYFELDKSFLQLSSFVFKLHFDLRIGVLPKDLSEEIAGAVENTKGQGVPHIDEK